MAKVVHIEQARRSRLRRSRTSPRLVPRALVALIVETVCLGCDGPLPEPVRGERFCRRCGYRTA